MMLKEQMCVYIYKVSSVNLNYNTNESATLYNIGTYIIFIIHNK